MSKHRSTRGGGVEIIAIEFHEGTRVQGCRVWGLEFEGFRVWALRVLVLGG